MGKGTYYIQPPLQKGPQTLQSMEIHTRPVGSRGKSLTLWAPLHLIFHVYEHLWPIVPSVNGFVGDGLFTRLVPTVIVMDFMYHFLRFLWSETLQIGIVVFPRVLFFLQELSNECVSGGNVLQLLCFNLVLGEHSIFEVGYNGIPPSRRRVSMKDSSSSL